MKRQIILLIILITATVGWAKIDLVTLPVRDTVQLTIYNSADLTLVRETRRLTLNQGTNYLQFSWANTLIDPTSLRMMPKAHADKIDIHYLTFPPRVQNLGLWQIESEIDGSEPVEILYLTSGLTWRAFYMGTLTPDEKYLQLQAYVRVQNHSGEDYENAQTRLIVGKVHLLDQIADLARRLPPYGSPVPMPTDEGVRLGDDYADKLNVLYDQPQMVGFGMMGGMGGMGGFGGAMRIKEIVKEGLSEYFLYTIEGTETIENNWAKRLPSFSEDRIPVESLYKYDEQRWGNAAVRYVSFANDTEHKLGKTPVPDGTVRIYRSLEDRALAYVGATDIKYIPVDEDIELNLGADPQVTIEPVLMDSKTDNYRFDRRNTISGWDEIQTWKVTVTNTRTLPVKVEIYRNFETGYWTIRHQGEHGEYEKEDLDTAKYTFQLEPRSKKEWQYVLTIFHGTRQEDWKEN
ncbi:MAG: DUF4139 domain-containing protein [Sedimentisphaerales bacterium]|nr:DUF4139 domain-containing protein [Sedimentisphaerales bacterium]